MPAIDEMNLEEVEAVMAKLRDRRRALKKTSKVAERKIGTLTRRRERLLERVRDIDIQIDALRQESTVEEPPARRRGRRPKTTQIATE